jgi:hypothetical protein
MLPLRRIRAAVIVAFYWGATWSVVGAALGAVMWVLGDHVGASWARAILSTAVPMAIGGILTGSFFAAWMALVKRDRTLSELRLSGMGIVGAVSSVVLLALVFVLEGGLTRHQVSWPVVQLAVASALGAGTGIATLLTARRGMLLAPVRAPLLDGKA